MKDIGHTSDYFELVDSFGYETLVDVHDNDYQGSSRYLLRDPATGRLGVLFYGWGSCSGCDALQACNSADEVRSLRDELHESIHWFGDRPALFDWLVGRDHKGQWYGGEAESQDFLDKALRYCGADRPPLSGDARAMLPCDLDWNGAAVLADAMQDTGWEYVPRTLRVVTTWVQTLARLRLYAVTE